MGFSQCGGATWTGPTMCPGTCKCISQGGFYSQCTPAEGAWSCEQASMISAAATIPVRVDRPMSPLASLSAVCVIPGISALAVALAAVVARRRSIPVGREDAHEMGHLLEAYEDA